MPWPTLGTYAREVEHFYEECVLIPKLAGGKPMRLPDGSRLKSYAGNFSVTFPIEILNLFPPKILALRCWTKGKQEIYEARYKKIKSYLEKIALPYFVAFGYNREGIFIEGETLPITCMEWAEGETLRTFIEQNLGADPIIFKTAAAEFQKMVALLHKHKISHGDLQDGNILFDRNGEDIKIKLIDYDSLCVPGICEHTTIGIPEYQHPRRISGYTITDTTETDYFSELVIYLSLMSLAEKPQLWDQFGNRTEKGLLFSAADFKNPTESKVFHALESLSLDIQQLALTLKNFCQEPESNQLTPLEDVLPKTRRTARFHHNFAEELYQRGRYDQAIISYQRAIYCDRIFKEAHYSLGLVYLAEKEYANATIPLYKAISLDQDFKEAHYALGYVRFELGDLQAAQKMASDALRIDCTYQPARDLLQDIKDTHYEQGLTFLKNRRYTAAIRAFKTTIAIDPNFKEAHRSLGIAYFELGNLEAAEKSAKDALAIDPDYTDVFWLIGAIKDGYYTRGITCLNGKLWTQAQSHFEAALRIDPKFIDAHCQLGFVYLKLSELTEAKREAFKALTLYSTYQPAFKLLKDIKREYKNLGDTHRTQKAYEKAIASYQQAIAIDPEYKEVHNNLGNLYWGMGAYAQAIGAYQQAIAIDNSYKEPRYNLGLTYFNMKKFQEARSAVESVLSLDPTHQHALGLLKNIEQECPPKD